MTPETHSPQFLHVRSALAELTLAGLSSAEGREQGVDVAPDEVPALTSILADAAALLGAACLRLARRVDATPTARGHLRSAAVMARELDGRLVLAGQPFAPAAPDDLGPGGSARPSGPSGRSAAGSGSLS